MRKEEKIIHELAFQLTEAKSHCRFAIKNWLCVQNNDVFITKETCICCIVKEAYRQVKRVGK